MQSFKLRFGQLGAGALLLALAAQPADAATHGHFRHRGGPFGRGVTNSRVVTRTPGATTVNRGVQTNDGHGYEQTRQTTYGNGGVTNEVTRTYDNGRTVSRSGSVTGNGAGSATRTESHTGAAGNTQTGWSTVYRTDDGAGRSRGFTTSSGRSASENGSVSFDNGAMTVDRSLQTGSGLSLTQSRTYTPTR